MRNNSINLLVFGRFPTERAYGVHVVSVAKAYLNIGYKPTIFFPSTNNEKTLPFSPQEYYQNQDVNFQEVTHLDVTKYFFYKILPKTIQGFIWSVSAYYWAKKTKEFIDNSEEICWSTNPILLYGSHKDTNYTIFELHGRARKLQALALKLLDSKASTRSLFVSSSEYGKEDLNSRGLKTDILFLPNGVDLDIFQPNLTSNIKDTQKDNCLHLGYVGQLETYGVDKGMHLVINALEKAINENPHSAQCGFVKVSIIGGPQESVEKLNKLIEKNETKQNLKIKLKYLGQKKQSDLSSLISNFDIGIVPYPKEEHIALYSSPMKIFEYAACGVPIVASDIHAHKSLSKLGIGMELYEAENLDSLSDLLSKYLHNEKRHGESGLSSLSNKNISIRDSLSWDLRGQKTLDKLFN